MQTFSSSSAVVPVDASVEAVQGQGPVIDEQRPPQDAPSLTRPEPHAVTEDELARRTSITSIFSMESEAPMGKLNFLVVFFAILVPNAALLVFFSTIGFGLAVFSLVAERSLSLLGDFLLSGSCLLAGFLFVIDWWRMPRPLKIVASIIPVCLFLAGGLLKGRKYPWAPMLLTLLFIPLSLGTIRISMCGAVKRSYFYGAVSSLAFFVAVVVALIWGWHVLIDDHRWEQSTKDILVAGSQDVYDNVFKDRPLVYAHDCGPQKNTSHLDSLNKDLRVSIELGCTQAKTIWFLSWMCPFVAIGSDLVLCVFCLFTGVVGQEENARSLQRNLTRFILMVSFILSGMYACSTISATSLRLGSTLIAFFFTALMLVIIWVIIEVDLTVLGAVAGKSKLVQQLIAVVQSDWTRAMGVGALGFPAIIFFTLNYLCQKCRICRSAANTDIGDKFTPLGRKAITFCRSWNWTSIFFKIVLLGELFFVLQVGVAKITYIFLSWLNTTLEKTSFLTVVFLVYVIGASMFLLPPVPGLPVYVFAGILLGEKGRQDERIGFWLGCLIAMGLGLFTKLCACVGQYMIGYFLGKSVKVQQLIGVDKVPTRAIEQILKSRGLSPGKVALLVGGPDWPTSVTCGIVKVNIPQMLLGTLPVVTLMAPCILAGACMGRVTPGEDSEWSMLANTFTAAAAVVNMAAMAYAVYSISNTIQKHGDELAKPRPEHEVVAELTRQEQAEVDVYKRVTMWSNLSGCWKVVLVTSATLMLLSNTIFVCFAEMCFRSFAVSSKINDPYEKDGLNGNVFNIIILPGGAIALGMFFVGVCLHLVISRVMSRRSRRLFLKEKA